MEQIKELEEVLELLNTKQYTKLRQYLAELNDADIAGLLEELEEEDMLKVFRILPKDLAADVFSYLDMDNQQKIITSLSDKEATNIIMTMIMIAVAMTITTIMRMKYLQAGEKKLLRSIQKKEFEQFLIHYLKKTPMSMELS